VSKLSFHVSSWTNLRQSPICIDVEHVTAKIIEPLHFLDRRRRRRLRQITRHELAELIREGAVPKPRTGRYNLLDRILDNLTVEIQSIDVTFQPAGKFKTRRVGPWTPPALRLQLFGVRLVSVTEFGHEASPDEVWRHNHHHHHRKGVGGGRDGSFLIYKKLETEYKISIVLDKKATRKNTKSGSSSQGVKVGENGKEKEPDTASSGNGDDDDDDDELVIPIVSSTPKDGTCNNQSKVQVQLAFQRRIRDGEYLAVQVDTTIPVVEIEMLATTIPHLAHLAAAVTYLLAKDRAFEDPLRAASSPGVNAQTTSPTIVKTASSDSLSQENQGEEVGLTAESLLDMAMADGLSDSSGDEEEGEDEGDKSERMVGNRIVEEEGSEDSEYEVEIDTGTAEATGLAGTESVPAPAQPTKQTASQGKPIPQTPVTRDRVPQSSDDRPVLVLPNGIVLHDKISLSVSVHHVTIRGTYRDSVDGHIQIVAKGVVAEAIWPQVTKVCIQCEDALTTAYRSLLFFSLMVSFLFDWTAGERSLFASFCLVCCDSGAFPATDTTFARWWRTVRQYWTSGKASETTW